MSCLKAYAIGRIQELSMKNSSTSRLSLPMLALALTAFVAATHAQPSVEGTFMGGVAAPVEHDGQHDFDFLTGTWKFHLRKLVNPLSGSATWQEYDGTINARPILGGKANTDEVTAVGPAGRIEGLTLRMYDTKSRQWSIYWGNIKDGSLGIPVIATVGSFRDGRGEFNDQEIINGRAIFVRYVWFDITPSSAKFEQSFSADGGKTWEVNWATTQTRTALGSANP
jgi:hypothetical protein